MSRRNLILGVVAVLLLAAAVGYTMLRPRTGAVMPKEFDAQCVCLACQRHVRLHALFTDPRPYVCPECGERAAYPLFECRKCGRHFVPNLVRRGDDPLPQLPMAPTCPACGSPNVGAYIGPETFTADELILPKWPQ